MKKNMQHRILMLLSTMLLTLTAWSENKTYIYTARQFVEWDGKTDAELCANISLKEFCHPESGNNAEISWTPKNINHGVTFNGRGHSITGLYIHSTVKVADNQPLCLGLFGVVGGEYIYQASYIKELGVEGDIYLDEINLDSNGNHIGGLAAIAYSTDFSDCYAAVNFTVLQTDVTGRSVPVGEICGYANHLTKISNCFGYGHLYCELLPNYKKGTDVGARWHSTAHEYDCYKLYDDQSTEKQFASGYVANSMNEGLSTPKWRQTLGIDPHPYLYNVPGHEVIAKSHESREDYAEKPFHNHHYVDGFCDNCQTLDPEVSSFQISTADQLYHYLTEALLRKSDPALPNYSPNTEAVLLNDIDLNDVDESHQKEGKWGFVDIVSESDATATIDGQMHKITFGTDYSTYAPSDYAGLIRTYDTPATLKIEDAIIQADVHNICDGSYSAVLVGYQKRGTVSIYRVGLHGSVKGADDGLTATFCARQDEDATFNMEYFADDVATLNATTNCGLFGDMQGLIKARDGFYYSPNSCLNTVAYAAPNEKNTFKGVSVNKTADGITYSKSQGTLNCANSNYLFECSNTDFTNGCLIAEYLHNYQFSHGYSYFRQTIGTDPCPVLDPDHLRVSDNHSHDGLHHNHADGQVACYMTDCKFGKYNSPSKCRGDQYEIYTPGELYWYLDQLRLCQYIDNAVLVADIDLTQRPGGWPKIDLTDDQSTYGAILERIDNIIDGQGHTIKIGDNEAGSYGIINTYSLQKYINFRNIHLEVSYNSTYESNFDKSAFGGFINCTDYKYMNSFQFLKGGISFDHCSVSGTLKVTVPDPTNAGEIGGFVGYNPPYYYTGSNKTPAYQSIYKQGNGSYLASAPLRFTNCISDFKIESTAEDPAIDGLEAHGLLGLSWIPSTLTRVGGNDDDDLCKYVVYAQNCSSSQLPAFYTEKDHNNISNPEPLIYDSEHGFTDDHFKNGTVAHKLNSSVNSDLFKHATGEMIAWQNLNCRTEEETKRMDPVPHFTPTHLGTLHAEVAKTNRDVIQDEEGEFIKRYGSTEKLNIDNFPYHNHVLGGIYNTCLYCNEFHECRFNDDGFCPLDGTVMPATQGLDGYYTIDNIGKLFWLGQQVNETIGGKVTFNARLTTDLDLTRAYYPTNNGTLLEGLPIGYNKDKALDASIIVEGTDSLTTYYKGRFIGQGHLISGLTTSLFYALSGGSHVDGLRVSGTVISAQESAAGLAQYVYNSQVTDCISGVNVESNTASYIGSMVGYISGTDAVLANCIATGQVKHSGTGSYKGVMAGYANKDATSREDGSLIGIPGIFNNYYVYTPTQSTEYVGTGLGTEYSKFECTDYTAERMASGALLYKDFVNKYYNQTVDATGVSTLDLWRQNIGYDPTPLPCSDHGHVYRRSNTNCLGVRSIYGYTNQIADHDLDERRHTYNSANICVDCSKTYDQLHPTSATAVVASEDAQLVMHGGALTGLALHARSKADLTLNGFYRIYDSAPAKATLAKEDRATLHLTFDDDHLFYNCGGLTGVDKVTYKRTSTLASGTFATLFLPYALSADDLEALQLQAMKFCGYNATTGVVSFLPVTETEAYVPYLITPIGDEAVALDFTLAGSIDVAPLPESYKATGELSTATDYGFYGVVAPETRLKDYTAPYHYFGFSSKNGDFRKANESGTLIRPYRAYFRAKTVPTQSEARLLPIFDDADADAIASHLMEVGPNAAPIYTIGGVRVDRPTRPGIYLQGGRKFIVK